MKPITKPFYRFIDFFCLPLYAENDLKLSKARAIVATNLVLITVLVVSMAFLIINQSLGFLSAYFAYGVILPDIIILSVMLFLVKHRPWLTICAHVTVLLIAITIFFGIYTNGGPIMASNNQMLIVLVVFAFFLTGGRGGLQWSVLIVAVEIVLYVLDSHGFVFPNYQLAGAIYEGEIYNFFTAFFAVIGLLFLIDKNRANLDSSRDRERLHFEKKATRDYLTQLANRECFEMALEECIAYCRCNRSQGALFYIDLDQFKPINDTHGHNTGDKVLQIVAERLQATVRKDDIVGRLGGDEFAMLLSTFDPNRSLEEMAQVIAESVTRPIILFGFRFVVKCSVGACRVPIGSSNAEQLLAKADEAMYRQKRRSKEQSVRTALNTAQ